jgi:hypothetical protein
MRMDGVMVKGRGGRRVKRVKGRDVWGGGGGVENVERVCDDDDDDDDDDDRGQPVIRKRDGCIGSWWYRLLVLDLVTVN